MVHALSYQGGERMGWLGGEKTDWVGKKLTNQFFPGERMGQPSFSPEEKTDWGEIPACYTGGIRYLSALIKLITVCHLSFEHHS